MNKTPVKENINLTSYIQYEYLKSLEPNADAIGLDFHEKMLEGDSIDSKLIERLSAAMFISGQASMYAILSEAETGIININEVKKYIEDIRPEIVRYNSSNKTLVFVAMDDTNASRTNGSIILDKFYHSFYHGMCDLYDAKTAKPKKN